MTRALGLIHTSATLVEVLAKLYAECPCRTPEDVVRIEPRA
ncbi:hypothetical protein ACTMTI_23375 [Nonomuraea sp. H19]